YVLALSLMGLVLGMWLRQSEGRGGPPPRPPPGYRFFTKTFKFGVENLCDFKKNKTPKNNWFFFFY
ncbi:hypothetical protein ACVGV4_00275, partial [Enterobacter hormaechei]